MNINILNNEILIKNFFLLIIYIFFQFFYEINNIINKIINFYLYNQENIHKLKKIISKILNNKNI